MPGKERAAAIGQGPGARERILESAYELFANEGVRAVGIVAAA